jgi:hypothetical protein
VSEYPVLVTVPARRYRSYRRSSRGDGDRAGSVSSNSSPSISATKTRAAYARATACLPNGGRVEVAQRMDGHSNAKTTGLDRRNYDISAGEV